MSYSRKNVAALVGKYLVGVGQWVVFSFHGKFPFVLLGSVCVFSGLRGGFPPV